MGGGWGQGWRGAKHVGKDFILQIQNQTLSQICLFHLFYEIFLGPRPASW